MRRSEHLLAVSKFTISHFFARKGLTAKGGKTLLALKKFPRGGMGSIEGTKLLFGNDANQKFRANPDHLKGRKHLAAVRLSLSRQQRISASNPLERHLKESLFALLLDGVDVVAGVFGLERRNEPNWDGSKGSSWKCL